MRRSRGLCLATGELHTFHPKAVLFATGGCEGYIELPPRLPPLSAPVSFAEQFQFRHAHCRSLPCGLPCVMKVSWECTSELLAIQLGYSVMVRPAVDGARQ
jgi:hypothetical protein